MCKLVSFLIFSQSTVFLNEYLLRLEWKLSRVDCRIYLRPKAVMELMNIEMTTMKVNKNITGNKRNIFCCYTMAKILNPYFKSMKVCHVLNTVPVTSTLVGGS